MSKVPKSLQGVLWSRDVKNLDTRRDKNYIIHQILAYGAWEHLKWLFSTYKKTEIKNAFLKYPEKDYSQKSFDFVKKILLNLKRDKIDKRPYVKTYPRFLRQKEI